MNIAQIDIIINIYMHGNEKLIASHKVGDQQSDREYVRLKPN